MQQFSSSVSKDLAYCMAGSVVVNSLNSGYSSVLAAAALASNPLIYIAHFFPEMLAGVCAGLPTKNSSTVVPSKQGPDDQAKNDSFLFGMKNLTKALFKVNHAFYNVKEHVISVYKSAYVSVTRTDYDSSFTDQLQRLHFGREESIGYWVNRSVSGSRARLQNSLSNGLDHARDLSNNQGKGKDFISNAKRGNWFSEKASLAHNNVSYYFSINNIAFVTLKTLDVVNAFALGTARLNRNAAFMAGQSIGLMLGKVFANDRGKQVLSALSIVCQFAYLARVDIVFNPFVDSVTAHKIITSFYDGRLCNGIIDISSANLAEQSLIKLAMVSLCGLCAGTIEMHAVSQNLQGVVHANPAVEKNAETDLGKEDVKCAESEENRAANIFSRLWNEVKSFFNVQYLQVSDLNKKLSEQYNQINEFNTQLSERGIVSYNKDLGHSSDMSYLSFKSFIMSKIPGGKHLYNMHDLISTARERVNDNLFNVAMNVGAALSNKRQFADVSVDR